MTQLLFCFGQGKHRKTSVRVSGNIFFKVICLIFAILTTLMLFSCLQSDEPEPPTVEELIDKARDYVRKDNIWHAIIEYENAIQLDPENETIYFELAENYVLFNNINKAIKAFQKAATINPKNKKAQLRLGQLYIKTGKLLKARKIISAVIATDPQTIKAYHLLSSIQIREKNFDEAIGTLKKAVLISDKDIKARLALASLYEASSKQKQAETMYEAALAIDPSQRKLYTKLCKLYRKDKDWDKMEARLLHALETPGIREAKLTNLARFYEGQKKYNVAETYYKRAVDEFPKSIQALMNLAEFQTRRNDRDNAIATMKKAVNLEPDNPKYLAGLAQVYLAFDMPEYFRNEIDKATELRKNDLDALFTVGRLLIKKGNFKGANDYISWVAHQNFTNAEAYYLIALCTKYQMAPDDPRRERVKRYFQHALLMEPDMLKARIELIEIYLYEGDTAKADEQLCLAFRQSPRSPRLFILLAALRLIQGDRDGARGIYTAIVKQNPSYIPGHLRLALLYTAAGEIDQAIRSYLRAYKIDARQVSILKKIADILVSEKRYKKAMAFLNLTKIPQDKVLQAVFENLKGEISVKAGEESEAINFFQASIDLDPAAITPKMNLARLFIDSKQMEKAKTIYEQIERDDPDHLTTLMALGVIHNRQGDLKAAESYYRRVLAIDANHGYASNNLAYILAEANRETNEALMLTRIALDQRYNDPNLFDTMGWIYYQKGSYNRTIFFIKESLALKPDNPIACYHLGMALFMTGEFEKARLYFEKALSLDHDFKHAENVRNMLKLKGENDET
ncbi:tetratricopeptide repeat protein [Desulfococcaceae bacterium HSG9]|nr:tetratricopeptide repeat protein [Desulfococcaceae bacterium HSG9]